jgi:hypothetical protein
MVVPIEAPEDPSHSNDGELATPIGARAKRQRKLITLVT